VGETLSKMAEHAHADLAEVRSLMKGARGRVMSGRTERLALIVGLFAIVGAILAGCGGGKGRGPDRVGSINVAIVDTPQTQDLARLTPSLFTDKTDIKVNYTILDEGTLREVTTRDVAERGRQFDAVMIGPYEAPQFGRDGHITDLTPMASSDRAYNLDDIIPSVRSALSYKGRLYASPF
jgi:sorbitol/mannitol transport system substrate-binding protein